jgi:hypothetical protein
MIYSGLVTLDQSGNVVPDGANSWDVSPDGKTYTFRLLNNKRWAACASEEGDGGTGGGTDGGTGGNTGGGSCDGSAGGNSGGGVTDGDTGGSTPGSIAWVPPNSSVSHTTTSQVVAPNVSPEMFVSRLYLFAQQRSRVVQIEAQSNSIASSDLAGIPSIWCIPPLDTRYC